MRPPEWRGAETFPTPPDLRNFRFQNLDLSQAKPDSAVVLPHGFEAAGHRTKDVVFENVKLPPGAIVEVDQAEDVRFTNVVKPDGARPAYQVSRSERVNY